MIVVVLTIDACSDLCFGEIERQSEVESLTDGQISGLFELVLQSDQLLVSESRPRPSWFTARFTRLVIFHFVQLTCVTTI